MSSDAIQYDDKDFASELLLFYMRGFCRRGGGIFNFIGSVLALAGEHKYIKTPAKFTLRRQDKSNYPGNDKETTYITPINTPYIYTTLTLKSGAYLSKIRVD